MVIAVVFPVVMYRSGIWTMKKAEHWKNWCFWIMVLEKTLESSLDCKEIQPVHPKGNQSWIFIGSTDAEAEAPILWPPNSKSRLIGKDPDVGKDRRQEEKRAAEDEMVRHHHWFSGYEFEQTQMVDDRRWWRTGEPGMLQSMGSQKVGHDLVTKRQQHAYICFLSPGDKLEWAGMRYFLTPFNSLNECLTNRRCSDAWAEYKRDDSEIYPLCHGLLSLI